jgi:hypothetical protein
MEIAATSGLQDTIELPGAIKLVSYGTATKLTPVFIFIPFWQDKEQRLSHGNGPTALGAVKLSRVKLIKTGLRPSSGAMAGGYGIEWSLFHRQNLWISAIGCAKK